MLRRRSATRRWRYRCCRGARLSSFSRSCSGLLFSGALRSHRGLRCCPRGAIFALVACNLVPLYGERAARHHPDPAAGGCRFQTKQSTRAGETRAAAPGPDPLTAAASISI